MLSCACDIPRRGKMVPTLSFYDLRIAACGKSWAAIFSISQKITSVDKRLGVVMIHVCDPKGWLETELS